jgi:small-conductance mechanosensitive channel/CRP-like cAMP-binding protein
MQSFSDPLIQFIALMAAFIGAKPVIRSHSPLKFAFYLLFFFMLSAWLLFNGIEPYATAPYAEDVWHRLLFGFAKAVWWFGGAMMLVSSVRLFLIFERRPREARLAQDLLAGMIYVGAALSVVAYVFGVPVGTLIATSGVFAVILGLALQSTLADVFSGIALNLGHPYAVGDWISLDGGVQGRVMETNWRATYLLNATNDLVVIPNSSLAKAQIVNLSSPDETHGILLTVKLVPSVPPATLQLIIETALLGSSCILRMPSPSVTVSNLSGTAVEFEISCRVRDASQVSYARNEIADLIFRHAHASDVQLAADVAPGTAFAHITGSGNDALAMDFLETMPLFSVLTAEERDDLSKSLTSRSYERGAKIADQGVLLPHLALVRKGVIVVTRDDLGQQTELNRLSPGDFFGERGVLLGSEEPGTIVALTSVVTLEIASDHLANILKNRPLLAQEIASTLSDRLAAEKQLQGGRNLELPHPETIGDRIRDIFQLPSHRGGF